MLPPDEAATTAAASASRDSFSRRYRSTSSARQGAEAQMLAPGEDGHGEGMGPGGCQQEDVPGRRLFEGLQEGVGRRGVHPVRLRHDKDPPPSLPGPKFHLFLEFLDRPDLDELAFRRDRDDIGMVFVLRLPAGRAGVAGRDLPLRSSRPGRRRQPRFFCRSPPSRRRDRRGRCGLFAMALFRIAICFSWPYDLPERHASSSSRPGRYPVASSERCVRREDDYNSSARQRQTSRWTVSTSAAPSMIRKRSGSPAARVRYPFRILS